MNDIMSSSRNTSGSQRRGRQSSGEARTTTDGEQLVKDIICGRIRIVKLCLNSQLVKRTGVAVDPSSGQIDMVETWWSDRIAEYGGTKGRLVHVLQKKPLPFKDLLDQIFGEHDVDQDERYSPHMLGLQLQQVQPTLDVDGITMVNQLQETQTAEPIVDLTSDQGCNRSIRSTSSCRLARRKTSFETQVESGFQRVVDTRQEFLEELRSRKIQKITYGDATSILEKLPIEQLGVFWWAANKLLKNDADIREAFVKLENEEIKIKYMESLLGTDRHGSPCNQVDLLTTSQNHFQSVGMGGSTAIGANTGGGYMSFLGVHSTELEEPRREPTSFVNLLNESNDDGLELRILELRSRGIQNLNEDELMELMLLEEEEFLQRYMHPILEYYKTNFFKEPMNKDWGNDDESDEQVNQNTSAGVYMKIVRDHIAEKIWTDKRPGSRRL
ncbi:hypothetical protein HID58_034026 [Brassica napus]|uniref:Uncharacterized protein n=1 Tax=Brassica napus TaxID=3708 RepID=A0ABQ8C2I7_BRANA|nr:hypothetical protein HID58_034026 [Brassica napus]